MPTVSLRTDFSASALRRLTVTETLIKRCRVLIRAIEPCGSLQSRFKSPFPGVRRSRYRPNHYHSQPREADLARQESGATTLTKKEW